MSNKNPDEIPSTDYLKKIFCNEQERRLQSNLQKLLENCPDQEKQKYREKIQGFVKLFQKYIAKSEKPLIWDEIKPVPRGVLKDYNDVLIPAKSTIKTMLNKLVVVKLNGGLGTSMKCDGPKSLIPVRNDLTFLDLSVQQVANLNTEFQTNVPLVLMNSFNTTDQTEQMLNKYRNLKIKIYTFQQNQYPRIYANNSELLPKSYNDPNKKAWYPPGHGDFYEAFAKSELIQKFRENGQEFCFVSNIDNLGAVVDFRILDLIMNYTLAPPPEFIMEVTKKTPGDVKGGTLIQYKDTLRLIEFAEVPEDNIEEFKSNPEFDCFNTNNLWIKLDAIMGVFETDNLSLNVIENRKCVSKSDGSKAEVIQLETAAGAAIQSFNGAFGIMVPRCRFLPVKTSSDLFLLKSNIYIEENGKLVMNPDRLLPTVPIIKFSDEHFSNYRDINMRFQSIPDILQLNHLAVCGDVYFGKNVTLTGNVTIIPDDGHRIDIPTGSIIQNKIVTGSLKIMDF